MGEKNPLAVFNAALNRSTPDTTPRATRQMLTAVEGVSVFDAYAERIVTTALRQKSYAAMYATLSDAMPFRDDICRRVIAALDSSDDETIAGAAEFLTELWRVGAATEEEFLSGIFREGSLDEFARVEIAFNALLRFGDALRDAEPARAYVAACTPDGRRDLSARGAAARLIFLAEEVHAFVETGHSGANRRHFRRSIRRLESRRARRRAGGVEIFAHRVRRRRRGDGGDFARRAQGLGVLVRRFARAFARARRPARFSFRRRRSASFRPGVILPSFTNRILLYNFHLQASDSVNIITVDCRQLATRTGFPFACSMSDRVSRPFGGRSDATYR